MASYILSYACKNVCGICLSDKMKYESGFLMLARAVLSMVVESAANVIPSNNF
jgi:hypothetical protein